MNPQKYKEIIVRYNTASDGMYYCWRVICDGKETVVNTVRMNGEIFTAHIKLPGTDVSKGHVCMRNAWVLFDKHAAEIRSSYYKNIVTVSLLKTITYRLFASIISFLIAYLLTGSYKLGLSFGLVDLLLKPIIYFCHEIIWQKTIKK